MHELFKPPLFRTALLSVLMLVTSHAHAFGDDDMEQVRNMLSIKIAPQQPALQANGIVGSSASSPHQLAKAIPPEQTLVMPRDEMMNNLDASYIRTLENCEGRFDLLVRQNERQIKRSEWIAIVGGTLGVIGTIATCPHCAAAMSGFAGLANPLQASFSQNNDTPQTTQSRLSMLASKINEEFDNYKKLPVPNWADGDKEFYSAYRGKVEQLQSIATSCFIYSKTYTTLSNPPPGNAQQ